MKKRKEEVEDEQVRKEIEKIREQVEAFERDITRLAALWKESSNGCGN